MTLNEALALIKGRTGRDPKQLQFLVCGFQPLHLGTFLSAYASERFPTGHFETLTGLYGDFAGNLAKASDSSALAAAAVLEWSDFDPRLGLRSSGGWSNKSKQDIIASAKERCRQFAGAIEKLAWRMPVAIAPPSLPLPPIGNTVRVQSSVLELELVHEMDALLLQLAHLSGVRIVDRSHLEQLSPGPTRLDAKMELIAGFPYSITHASALARCLADVLYPRAPKKGLITDLDDTLWAGIVGEVGADAVSWHQERHSQTHGLYQQMLSHLADCGVLLGVSSKNELDMVQAALSRQDLLIEAEALYPIFADWGPKSRAVDEILRTWNIGADSVVFVDDNRMELSEVQQAFPAITCLEFPKNDPAKLWSFLGELRDLFGKPVLLEEDQLRRISIRAASRMTEAPAETSSSEFLRSLHGTVTLDYRKNPSDRRVVELINKTNQFNLNGLRMSEGEWQRFLEADNHVTITVSYQDKFGPLGKIAVVLAQQYGKCLRVSHWVMSCRAFSRRIEHHTLDSMFRHWNAEEIEFAFQLTDRNRPLQEFFQSLGIENRLRYSQFLTKNEALPHQTSELDQ